MRLEPEAILDLNETWAWYENERPGLGDRFLDGVEAIIEQLRENPFLYQCVLDERIRRSLLHRFPYAVYYSLRGDFVRILGIVHVRRDPRDWSSP